MPHLPGDGITAFLANGGTIENAQLIAAHESPRTTKIYDRTSDEITLDEVDQTVSSTEARANANVRKRARTRVEE